MRYILSWFVFFSFIPSLFGQTNAQDELNALSNNLQVRYLQRQQRIEKFMANASAAKIKDVNGNDLLLFDIDEQGKPVYRIALNAEAAHTTGASSLHDGTMAGLKLQGQGLTIGVWDDGLVKDHIELGNRVLSTQGTAPADHATHVTGTLIASGVNTNARGMAPSATALTYYFANDDAVMAALARPDQSSLLFSNHSYGTATGWQRTGGGWQWMGSSSVSMEEDYKFGFYGQQAKTLDQIAYLAPYYSIFWAAGNDRADPGDGSKPPDCNSGTGYDCIIPDAVAKNVFTIGAVDKVSNYISANSVAMSYYSSWGPTDDGRIKPDLVGAGTNLFSLSAIGENTYTTLGGTSMSTPNVSGSLMLIQELHKKLNGGNFMKSASLKALAIHTAKEAGLFPGPDYRFGWGLVDVAAAANVLMSENDYSVRLEELTLYNAEIISYVINPVAGKKITATIVWTDPAGNPLPISLDPLTPMLVNDLDIRIVDEQTNVSQKPWVLDPLNPSRQAYADDNFRDNVEKIEFNAPEGKPYRLDISHKGELVNNKQDFSLVITYTSADSPGRYYWIGGSGSWNDPNHWAKSTGGASDQSLPTATSVVIFDENSFSDGGFNEVALTGNEEVSSLVWINSKDARINLSGNQLKITKEWKLSTIHEVIQNGTVVFDSNMEGKISWDSDSFQPVALLITKGNWRWVGNSRVRKLRIEGGEMHGTYGQLYADTLILTPDSPTKINWDHAEIVVGKHFVFQQSNVELSAVNATLTAKGSHVELDWNDVTWPGSIRVETITTMKGDNSINNLEVGGKIVLDGSSAVHTLKMDAGSALEIASNELLKITNVTLNSDALHSIAITGGAQSAIQFEERSKFCFDFLAINSVAVAGPAVVNAGENSSVQNATGWKAGKCEEILYTDFLIEFACEGGMINLIDKTQGNPTSWNWTVTNPDGSEYEYEGKVQKHPAVASGDYTVRLATTSTTSADQHSIQIAPAVNSLPDNEVIVSGEQLISFRMAEKYQWFKNGNLIGGEELRTLSISPEEGLYFVVTYNNECSKISDSYIVTAIASEPHRAIIFPNPAQNEIEFENGGEIKSVYILNSTGTVVMSSSFERKLSIRHLPNGLYFVILESALGRYRTKLVVHRGN